ncbi:serine hydrolase [Phenylobacterium sp. Root700]|uniref:serine hydrolase domain-containing protein n=1 Tax=Phenylobacterium sp. Root700 TaxID=1736591 RepID=UPI0006FDAEF6|nr:serine hydrolase domain-containing protein [Phenylobacterium sp. Root700]KRB49633.1 hypothetical protein ASE02_17655 [Phenylobacterium sp. Root700]
MLAHLAAVMCLLMTAGTARAEKLVDPVQLEAWADQYYGQAVAEKRTAGITVSVVQDGQVVFAKGYGYSDYAKRIPVSPEESGFIVGSITKTFVATAIGQLVDRGVIKSLDDPANKYLKRVQLPGDRGARVTIRQLLNHRAGFEDIDFGFLDRSSQTANIPLSAAEIERFMPELALEPGGPANYSNWSFSLLGFLIEDVTGQRLDTYLKANIWDPLGMSHTSMAYGKYPANLSLNYVFEKDGTPVAQKPALPHPWIVPAGTIVSTANDIARYMQAQMFRGEDGGYPLVSPAMFKELQTERYRNAPISLGFAHTFWTMKLNGAQTIEHGGGAPGFQSMMVMIPEKRFGFFVSSMQGGLAGWSSYTGAEKAAGKLPVQGPPTGYELRESFVERFLQQPAPQVSPGKSDLKTLVGTYWTQKRPFTTVEALGQAFNPAAVFKVERSKDGRGLLLNGVGPYVDIGGGVFASPTGKNIWDDPYTINRYQPPYIAFTLNADGTVAYLTPGLADQAWAPASPIFNPKSMLLAFIALGGVAATGFFLFLWPQAGRFRSLTNGLGVAAALIVLAFPASILAGFAKGDSLINQMALGDKGRFWMMVVVANLAVLIALALSVQAVRMWTRRAPAHTAGWGHWGRRVHVTFVAVATLGLLVVFGFFKLLGVHMPG